MENEVGGAGEPRCLTLTNPKWRTSSLRRGETGPIKTRCSHPVMGHNPHMISLPLSSKRLGIAFCAVVATTAAVCSGQNTQRQTSMLTPLDKYVHKDDGAFSYEIVNEQAIAGGTLYAVKMISQKWRTPKDSGQPVWWHFLNILVPDNVGTETGMLIISGGSNRSDTPRKPREEALLFALGSKSVVCELRMVPNQPVVFPGKDREHYEDAFIAYTWDKFLRTGDKQWPAQLPMCKSAVRAMDAVTAICKEKQKLTVDKFVVAGASKRGWTTWITAAVDKRVVGIVPIVIDMLNVVPSFKHHYQAYGFFAEAVNDYVEHGIMDWQDRPEYNELIKIVEPYEYRDRLTMPKYIVNASGDQFFLPDSSKFYFDRLKGEKYLRYVPNAEHSLKGTDAPQSIAAFYVTLLSGKKRPEFDWKIESPGTIRVTPKDKASQVLLWQASNTKARDFRVDTIGRTWTSTPMTPGTGGSYVAKVKDPEKGWTAFFVELTYPSDTPWPMKFTTGVSVVPDKLPHRPYKPNRSSLPPLKSN